MLRKATVRTMTALVLGSVGLLSMGCAVRGAPYHFRSAMLGGVSAPALSVAHTSPPPPPVPVLESTRRQLARRQKPKTLEPAPRVLTVPAANLARSGDSLAASLRGMVGRRDTMIGDVAFATSVLAHLGARVDADLRGTLGGVDLVALAQARGAWQPDGTPVLGDLVVFDRVVGTRPASLVGVVISRNQAGTVEFLYLARGVVRRGFVNSAEAHRQRDGDGRILNTFVRPSDGGDGTATQYLASELFAGLIRLEHLVDQ